MDQQPEPKSKSQKKRRLDIDWDAVLDGDAPPPELIVKPMASDHSSSDGLESIPEHKLLESIRSKKNTLDTTGRYLRDGGAKIRATIKRYEDELARRERNPPPVEVCFLICQHTN